MIDELNILNAIQQETTKVDVYHAFVLAILAVTVAILIYGLFDE